MPNQKKKVLVYTPKAKNSKTPLKYTYQKSEVFLSVSSNGYYIETSFEKIEADTILDKNRIRDAIKKAELLYLIFFSKKIHYDKLCVSIDGVVKELNVSKDNNHPFVYSIIEKMDSCMPEGWRSNSVLKGILSTPKTKQGRLFASLYALVIAKSKKYATEKFMYLWMAMNGLYGEIADTILHLERNESEKGAEIEKRTVEWLKKEYGQIKFLALLQGWQYDLGILSNKNKSEKQRYNLRLNAEKLCEHIDINNIKSFYTAAKNNDRENDVITELDNVINYYLKDKNTAIHPYAFMTLWLPYQIRCKYFHGELPLSLLCFENEHPLPAIMIINIFLEAFLDEELPKWFDEDRVRTELIPKVLRYAKACKCKDNHLIDFQLLD